MLRGDSIWRTILATVLTVAYLVMSVASATHGLFHLAEQAAASAHASSAATGKATGKASTKTSANEIAGKRAERGLPSDSKESHCFFCVHGPTVLLLVTVLAIIGVLRHHRPATRFVRRRRILPPTLAVISLRAPPALA